MDKYLDKILERVDFSAMKSAKADAVIWFASEPIVSHLISLFYEKNSLSRHHWMEEIVSVANKVAMIKLKSNKKFSTSTRYYNNLWVDSYDDIHDESTYSKFEKLIKTRAKSEGKSYLIPKMDECGLFCKKVIANISEVIYNNELTLAKLQSIILDPTYAGSIDLSKSWYK